MEKIYRLVTFFKKLLIYFLFFSFQFPFTYLIAYLFHNQLMNNKNQRGVEPGIFLIFFCTTNKPRGILDKRC